MTHEEHLKYAWSLYYNGIAAEGAQRRAYLEKARQILLCVPSGYRSRENLMSRLEFLL